MSFLWKIVRLWLELGNTRIRSFGYEAISLHILQQGVLEKGTFVNFD